MQRLSLRGARQDAPRFVLLPKQGCPAGLCSPRGERKHLAEKQPGERASSAQLPAGAPGFSDTFLLSSSVGRDQRKNWAKCYRGENGWLGLGVAVVFSAGCDQPVVGSRLCGGSRRWAEQEPVPIGVGIEPRLTSEPPVPVPCLGGHRRALTATRDRASAPQLAQEPHPSRAPPAPRPRGLAAAVNCWRFISVAPTRRGPAGAGGERRASEGAARRRSGRQSSAAPARPLPRARRVLPSGNEILAARRVRFEIQP